MSGRVRRARLYAYKWRWYQRNHLPWRRLALHREFMAREAFLRWPVEGNILEALRENRMWIGKGVHLEPHAWIDVNGRLWIGDHTSFNIGVFVSVVDYVEIGAHCMFANGCFISDGNHRYDDPAKPVPWQGLVSKGPTIIGDNVWCGANAVITGGVTIGERCVIGANSVVTSDIPPYSLAAGAPAKVVRQIEYGEPLPGLGEQPRAGA